MKVLFVCKSNVGRSQMAEVFFNRLSKKNHAISAGTWADRLEGRTVGEVEGTEVLLKILDDEGMDISKAKRNQLTPMMVRESDRIIVMAERHQCPDYLLNSDKVVFWDVEDANGRQESYDFAVKSRELIKKLVEQLVREIG